MAFSLGLKGVTLDGEEIAGLVKPVNAQEYADIATIPLYNGMGASYVIDSDGPVSYTHLPCMEGPGWACPFPRISWN